MQVSFAACMAFRSFLSRKGLACPPPAGAAKVYIVVIASLRLRLWATLRGGAFGRRAVARLACLTQAGSDARRRVIVAFKECEQEAFCPG